MTVTLTPELLIQPAGELEESFFPGEELMTLLAGWISVTKVKVEADSSIASADHNAAAEAWVYYRAYTYIANRLAVTPKTVTIAGQVTKTFGDKQADAFRTLADSYRTVYEDYTAIEETAADSTFPASSAAVTVARW